MKTIVLGTLILAATIAAVTFRNADPGSANGARSANAAFRDGLFLGKMDAQQNREEHPTVGRWARAEDRAAYTEGYGEGYSQISLARGGPQAQAKLR